jgi:hypothetical protein
MLVTGVSAPPVRCTSRLPIPSPGCKIRTENEHDDDDPRTGSR